MNSQKSRKISLKLKKLTAKSVRELTDTSYKQINSWDNKSILPMKNRGKSFWRRFSGVDIIKLLIMRKMINLGIPISKLRPFYKWINKPKAIDYLVEKAFYGLNVYLYSDLKDNFGFYSDTELKDIISMNKESVVILIPLTKIVTDIVNRLSK